MRAATYGPVASPAFSAMQLKFSLGASLEDAEMLIVDGDAKPPGTLRDDPVLNRHLSKGRPVMFVDLRNEHKERDLADLLLSVRMGDSHATIARRTLDKYLRPEVFTLEFTNRGQAPSRPDLLAFTQAAREFLDLPGRTRNGDFDPPPGLIYVTFNHAEPVQSYQFTSHQGGRLNDRPAQNTTLIRNQQYTLFLQNQNNADGDFQWLVVHSNVQTSPINSNLGTNNIMIEKQGSVFVSREMGYFTGQVEDMVTPADPSLFASQQNQPQNTDKQEQVRTAVNFGINFNPVSGGTGAFTYQEQDINNVQQWSVFNNSSGENGDWTWTNQDPWMFTTNTSVWYNSGYGGGYEGASGFRIPNALATGLITIDTKIVYQTPAVLNSTQIFNHETIVTYMDVWALAFRDISHTFTPWQYNYNYAIKMAAVVPIAIESITFSQNPVNAATTSAVTGTVTLASPAVCDTVIYLSATSPYANASVLPNVIVPQGQTTATFQVLVNTNEIASGGQVTANIEAFYAKAAQAGLVITNN
jgi:hypothetical protein